jgi:hypothetical protein
LQPDKYIKLKKLFDITSGTAISPSQSLLMIELGERHCCAAVMKREGFEAQRLIYYETDKEEQMLNEVIDANNELNIPYSDVLISYSFAESIMTPSMYYDYNDSRKMLHLLYGDGKDSAVLSEHLSEWHLYNVYGVPRTIHSWISMRFHSGKYWHHYTSSLMTYNTDEPDDVLLVDFKTGQFSVIVIKSGQLQLLQTFLYHETADVLYYLLKIVTTFNISQRTVQLILSGLIERNSSLYKELYSYFVDVSFRTAPEPISLPYSFRQYPEHFFSSLFNLASCVL